MKKNIKKIVLLDSHAILHRAYHALPDFSSKSGEPTGALYGLVTLILKIVSDIKPDYILAAYDLPGPTYRHEAYVEYKAGRQKTDDALIQQIERSLDVFKAFSIPLYSKPGFEADDMLGTIVEQVKNSKDVEVVIASGDMDTLQLVKGKKVQVYTLKKGIKDTIMYDEEGVKERYGFGPELLPDYKGLRGDPSDNIIGIAGIGEKTATVLIQKFGTIEEIYTKLKKGENKFIEAGIKPRIIELLKSNEEEAQFSKMLATIRRDAPLEFKIPDKEWKQSVDITEVKKLFAELEFKTLGSRVEAALRGEIKKETKARDEITPVESGPSTAHMFGQSEVIDHAELEETLLALWILDSNKTTPTLEDIYEYSNTKNFQEARKLLLSEIKKEKLDFVFEEIEKPLIPVVHKMQDWGVKIDIKELSGLSKKYHTELAKLERDIWEAAGGAFNINSPKQLGNVLFDTLGLSVKGQKKTAGGARSTKESELEKLIDLHPVVAKVLEYREYQKLLSTYIDSIPNELHSDGKLHAEFHQAGAATGRMSSSDPNLQNIPVKSELGRAIRSAFIADAGYKLVAFDYSQIELRIAAFLSGDEKLGDIFRKGEDVHSAVAAQVFGVLINEVSREMRSRAKVINFGILYGMGVNALRTNLGTDRKEAQAFYDQYFETFTTLAAYLEKTKAEAKRLGYTETYFGRRRYFEGIKSHLPFIRASAERMAINAPIQGTQADIIKLAMRRIDEYLVREKLEDDAHLILQVHDEVIFEVKERMVEKISKEVRRIMENVIDSKETHGIVFQANASVGDDWGNLNKIS